MSESEQTTGSQTGGYTTLQEFASKIVVEAIQQAVRVVVSEQVRPCQSLPYPSSSSPNCARFRAEQQGGRRSSVDRRRTCEELVERGFLLQFHGRGSAGRLGEWISCIAHHLSMLCLVI